MTNPITRESVEQLLHPTIVVAGRPRRVALRVPSVDEVMLSMSEEAAPGEERIERRLRTEVLAMAETVDGDEVGWDLANTIVRDTDAIAGFIRARNAIFEVLREGGRIFAECPHCRRHEMSLSLFALVAGIRHAPWPLTHPNAIVLSAPSLATPWPRGLRPDGVPKTSRIRFELPSAASGLEPSLVGGVLGDLDVGTDDREVAAWQRWAPRGAAQPEERSNWVYEEPGFRALLRLSLILASLEGADDEINPATLEPMPVPDFLFLDTLYYLTHNVDVLPSTTLSQPCGGCGQRFVPVR